MLRPPTQDRFAPAGPASDASSRSSFRRLSPIRRTLRACATITSCPNSLSNRLTQGDCIPVSSAIRRGIPPNTSCMAFGVVLSFCSKTIEPASSSCRFLLLSRLSYPQVSDSLGACFQSISRLGPFRCWGCERTPSRCDQFRQRYPQSHQMFAAIDLPVNDRPPPRSKRSL